MRALQGTSRRTGRERRGCRDISKGRNCRRDAPAPKVISSCEEAGESKSFKRSCEKLLHISGGRKINAILPKDRWWHYLGSNARKNVAVQVILSTEYITKRQLMVQELSTTPQQHPSEVFVWERVLAADAHTLPVLRSSGSSHC